MKKQTLLKVACDSYVIVSVLTGIVLMALTLLFRVNPVEGSVVHNAVRGTMFHYVLLVTTMPAWIAGIFLSRAGISPYPVMFIFQIILYVIIGLVLRWIAHKISRRRS